VRKAILFVVQTDVAIAIAIIAQFDGTPHVRRRPRARTRVIRCRRRHRVATRHAWPFLARVAP
jgi:hypothetical protein